ncbi:MAG: hypothetical protein CMA07_07020 [Euryarchaeota archaeon]|nr:hypothetical protein [Euryarchaeota archaeon]|tara:strand:+ start:2549 stop:2764 length:216 start_codon:yes stop_codon:yes gene_type:complete
MEMINKVQRYAMIKAAAEKIQKQKLLDREVDKQVEQVKKYDDMSAIHWSDAEDYAKAHYGGIYENTRIGEM